MTETTPNIQKTCGTCGRSIGEQERHFVDTTTTPQKLLCYRCGWDAIVERYLQTGILHPALTMQAALCETAREYGCGHWHDDAKAVAAAHADTFRAVARESKLVEDAMKRFELSHWFGFIQSYYHATTIRGHSSTHERFKAVLWGCAGRVLLTVKGNGGDAAVKDAQVTMVFDEDSKMPRGGIQSIDGTAAQALELIRLASEQLKAFVPDEEVTFA
jgi:hypothetical protein